MVRAALRCQQEGRRWGRRPTTGEEEALPKANAICRKGMAEGWEPAIVWADVFPPGQPRSSAGEHLGHIARGPGLLSSQRPRNHFREGKKARLLSSMKESGGTSFFHPFIPSCPHLLICSLPPPKYCWTLNIYQVLSQAQGSFGKAWRSYQGRIISGP